MKRARDMAFGICPWGDVWWQVCLVRIGTYFSDCSGSLQFISNRQGYFGPAGKYFGALILFSWMNNLFVTPEAYFGWGAWDSNFQVFSSSFPLLTSRDLIKNKYCGYPINFCISPYGAEVFSSFHSLLSSPLPNTWDYITLITCLPCLLTSSSPLSETSYPLNGTSTVCCATSHRILNALTLI